MKTRFLVLLLSALIGGGLSAEANPQGYAPPALGSKGAPPPPGVQRIDVREGGLYGAFYVPQGHRLPAIIVIGGSEGGVQISTMATSFAKAGFAVLALAYWNEEGLPKTLEGVPLEYFDKAVTWLKAQRQIDPQAIGVVGWSRGSEAALLLATRNKDVHAVTVVAPSGVVWPGMNPADMSDYSKPAWTAEGKPLTSATPDAAAFAVRGRVADSYSEGLKDADRRPETAIPVERINGPLLLISGQDDGLWPSSRMADRIVARLQAARFPHTVEHLSYPGAGHVIFVGEPDSAMARAFGAPNPVMGGSPEANRNAWRDNWPRTVAFFETALKGKGQ